MFITAGVGVYVLKSSLAAPGENPSITYFTASPSTIKKGGVSNLSWAATDVTKGCDVSNTSNDESEYDAFGNVNGAAFVNPSKTTSYTLICKGQCAPRTNCYIQPQDSRTVRVTVKAPVTPSPSPSPSPPPAKNPSPSPSPSPNPSPTSPPPAPAKVKSKTGDMKAPSSPEDFSAISSSSGTSVDLSWTKASDNVGVVAYSLEQSTDQTNWTYLSKSIETTSYKDEDLDPDTIYYYRLRAKDKAGNESAASFAYVASEDDEVAVTPEPAPTPPPAATTKKSNTGKIIGIVIGSILLIVGIIGGTMYFRKLVGGVGSDEYDDQIREETVAHSIEETIADPDHPPHESESLKDMVMKDNDFRK